MGQIRLHRTAIEFRDWRYLGYTQQELTDFLKNFEPIQRFPYEAEYRDCDEFADFLRGNVRLFQKGIPFGLIKLRRSGAQAPHLANVFLDEMLTVKIIDFKRAGNVLLDVDPSAFYFGVEI